MNINQNKLFMILSNIKFSNIRYTVLLCGQKIKHTWI